MKPFKYIPKEVINSSQKKEGRYYTFPLSILSLSNDPETLYIIINTYFLTWHSDLYASGLDEKQFEMLIDDDKYEIRHDIYQYSICDHGISEDHIAYTAKRFELDDELIHLCLQNFDHFNNIYSEFIDRYGSDAMVRIRKDIVDDMRTGQIELKMFRAFCGILSYIGDKPYARVANSIISLRASGFKSKKVHQDYLKRDSEFPKLLTNSQVKTARKKLRDRGFFLYLTVTKNRTYYTIRMKLNDFKNVLIKKIKKENEKNKHDLAQDEINALIDDKKVARVNDSMIAII